MSDYRNLTRTETRLAKSMLLLGLVSGLTWIWLFFTSGDWVNSDQQVFLALTLIAGGMLWLGFAFAAVLLLLFGVRSR